MPPRLVLPAAAGCAAVVGIAAGRLSRRTVSAVSLRATASPGVRRHLEHEVNAAITEGRWHDALALRARWDSCHGIHLAANARYRDLAEQLNDVAEMLAAGDEVGLASLRRSRREHHAPRRRREVGR